MTRKIVIKEYDMANKVSLSEAAKALCEVGKVLDAEIVVEAVGGLGLALQSELSKLRKLTGKEILAALDVHSPSPELLEFVESLDPELNTVAGFRQTGRTTAMLARMIFRLNNTNHKQAIYLSSSEMQSKSIQGHYLRVKAILNVDLPRVVFACTAAFKNGMPDELKGLNFDDTYLDLYRFDHFDYWFINDLGFKNITMCIDSPPKSKITVLQQW